ILWEPPTDVWQRSQLGRFTAWLESTRGLRFPGYDALWQWSVTDLDGFWAAVWDYFGIEPATPYEAVLADRDMPGARWFPGATLNYAGHLVQGARRTGHPDGASIVSYSQTRATVRLTPADLEDLVARARAGFVELGVGRGDRVAAYLPSLPETVAAYLACLSLGAIWSSCAPEFGTRSVVDRLAQTKPKVLLAIDGYRFVNKPVDRLAEVAEIRTALPSLQSVVALPYLYADDVRIDGAVGWSDFTAVTGPLTFDPVPFDHPLHILFSSGTTGLPKPIVHGHGGVLLDQLKSMAFHQDLGPDDRMFFFTTTGWMAWNWLVSALGLGTSIVLLDGNLLHPDLGAPWRLASDTGTTTYGASPAFLSACRKAGVVPKEVADLSRLRTVCSGGSPLSAELFRWVYGAVGDEVYLHSFSGGTEICGAFVGGAPVLPVRAGEITCRWLGCDVEAFDEHGRPVVDQEGELVLVEPLPSMPVGLWNDPEGRRYRATYFDQFPGVWRHGDRITISDHGGLVISGRSDATLNRGGVRLGTSEFYAVVEALPEISDSLVVHLEDPDGGAGQLILFVVLAEGTELDGPLRARITGDLRRSLSPRHVPDVVQAVPAVPRTITGKKLEVPVKRILTGTPPDAAASRGALLNPDALGPFETLGRQWGLIDLTAAAIPVPAATSPSEE